MEIPKGLGREPGRRLGSALHSYILAESELDSALLAIAAGNDEKAAAKQALRTLGDANNQIVTSCGRLLIRLHENFKARQGGGNA